MFFENLNNFKILNMALTAQIFLALKYVDKECGQFNFLPARILTKLGVE